MTPHPPTKGPWIHGRRYVPIGIAYVAAVLEKNGFQVQILDNYLLEKSIGEIKVEVKKLNPEIVGITCSSVTYSQVIDTAKAVKEVLPSCKVVVGGWHPSYMPESMLEHSEIDYVVMGEGERAMVELAAQITKGENSKAIANIAGVAYRHEGKIVKNTPQFIKNMDEIPFPAWHLLPINRYERKMEYLDVQPVDNMSIARGCPFNCAFCEVGHLWGKTCRAFSPQRVVEEIEYLIGNYATRGIYFINDNFTVRKKETIELCELMKKKNFNLEWVCDTRADLISRDLLKAMKAAGCKTIWFGVESGSPRILEKLNKGLTLEQIESAFKMCREEDIQTACSIMMGIPGETVKDMEASFKFARKLDPDYCRFNIFIAVPGSSLYKEVMEKGLYDKIEDYAAYVKTEDFNYESVQKIQNRFHMTFEKSPKRILRKMRKDGVLTTLKKAPTYFLH
jgi:anaerobic magnesium-protoporphyrin IX monomethyl ester cyclase